MNHEALLQIAEELETMAFDLENDPFLIGNTSITYALQARKLAESIKSQVLPEQNIFSELQLMLPFNEVIPND